MNLLIPYVPLLHHTDPVLEEFTYGDIHSRGRKLKEDVQEGEYLFFHTSINSRKCITAYYVVDRVMETPAAAKEKNIVLKYKNPHIKEYLQNKRNYKNDVLVFGDPILSRRLDRPLEFNRKLAQKLSLDIKFRQGFTDSQCIGSATRQWRELSRRDVQALLNEIKDSETEGITIQKTLSTEEVTEIIEKDIENFIEANTKILGDSLKLTGRQIDTPVGRIDLMFEDSNKKIIIVELKLNKIGREALNQIRRYMNHVKKETRQEVSGIIVCNGVMPAFEDEFKTLKNVKILKYGWKLQVSKI